MKLVRENIQFTRGKGLIPTLDIGLHKAVENWLKEYVSPNQYMSLKDQWELDDNNNININWNIDLSNKRLTELPDYITFDFCQGYFKISDNPLTTLRGVPKKIGIDFYCENTNISSLEYFPSYVSGDIFISKIPGFTVDEMEKEIKGICQLGELTTIRIK